MKRFIRLLKIFWSPKASIEDLIRHYADLKKLVSSRRTFLQIASENSDKIIGFKLLTSIHDFEQIAALIKTKYPELSFIKNSKVSASPTLSELRSISSEQVQAVEVLGAWIDFELKNS